MSALIKPPLRVWSRSVRVDVACRGESDVSVSPFCSRSALQELRDVLNKQLWVLVLRTMIAVGVQNELRVGQVLLEDERVHRIDEHVVAAVYYERRLSDLLQVSIGIFRRSAPFLQRSQLCRSDLFVWQRIAVFLAHPLSLKILPSRRLTPLRWSKKGPKPDLIGRVVLCSEDLLSL